MSALDNLEGTFRRWGIPVIVDTVPGYPGAFAPTHVMVHHTVSDPGKPAPSRRVVREGRPGLPGPLCHVLVRRDLRVEVVSRGRANHAGKGGPWGGIPEDTGNTRCVGIEIEHAGTSAEPWTPEYMAFCRRVSAAVLDHLNEPATRLLAHKEWAPDRKTDPYRWVMDAERREVARLLAAGPPTDLLEELMATPQERADLIADIAAAVAQTPQPLFSYAKELYADADGKMSLSDAAQHAAAQALAANRAANSAKAEAAAAKAETVAVMQQLAELRVLVEALTPPVP